MSTNLGIEYSLSRSSILILSSVHAVILQGSSVTPLTFEQNSSNVSFLSTATGGEADVDGPASCCLSRTRRVLGLVSWLFKGRFSFGTAPVSNDFLFQSIKGHKVNYWTSIHSHLRYIQPY